MKDRTPRTKHVTPIGTVRAAFLHSPCYQYGKHVYRCDLVLSPEDAEPMVERITAGMNANLRAARESAKTSQQAASYMLGDKPFEVMPNKSVLFRFRSFPRWNSKGPKLIDPVGQPLTPDDRFTNGTRARVSYEEHAWINEVYGCGISLKLITVQRFPGADSEKGKQFLANIPPLSGECSAPIVRNTITPSGDVLLSHG